MSKVFTAGNVWELVATLSNLPSNYTLQENGFAVVISEDKVSKAGTIAVVPREDAEKYRDTDRWENCSPVTPEELTNDHTTVYIPFRGEFVFVQFGSGGPYLDYTQYRFTGDPDDPFAEVDGGQMDLDDRDYGPYIFGDERGNYIEDVLMFIYDEVPMYFSIPERP
jgi:hypothetical protein